MHTPSRTLLLRCPLFVSWLILLTACINRPTPTALPTVVITNTPTSAPLPSASSTPAPTPTPVPIELIVCQTHEPASLYLYGDSLSARAGIFDALFDGPIDAVGYAYQPVILESLPSLENGGAALNEVEVRPGDRVVDADTGAVVPLAEGVHLAQPDGSVLVYTGNASARSLQVSATFTLKPGLLWSDGQPLTADDSLFSFEVASSYVRDQNPNALVNSFVIDRTARYEAVNARTARWMGVPGWRDTNFYQRFWTPLPRHAYGQVAPAQLLVDANATRNPLGWGPFVLSEWAPGDHLTLTRNPNYFRAAEGLPRVDRVTFRFGLQAEAILTELITGRCHIGAQEVDFSQHLPFLLEAQATGVLNPQFVTATSFEHLDFGIQPAEDYSRAAGNDLFQDVRVRHAVAHCLDRQALVDELLNGLGEVPAVYVPAAHPLYAVEGVTVYAFDPMRGRALLEEAGWMDGDGDGVRDKGRRRLALDYASGPEGSPFREALMQHVQIQLRTHCGIEVRPQLYTLDELYDDFWPTGVLFGRRFDLAEFAWEISAEPHCELYLTDAIPSKDNPAGTNNLGYSNPAFDQACLAAQTALDEATRRARHAEAQAIFTQDLPSLPLFIRATASVAHPRVDGYRSDSTSSSDLWNIEQIGLSAP